jgi:cysteine-rich repeat protein
VLAEDDDSGDGLCAEAVASGLAPGSYYVAVSAAPGAEPATFPYRLQIAIGVCGDGQQTAGEECDDNNLDPDDGCSSTCTNE